MNSSPPNNAIIQSILDLDVYKINMMYAARKFYPATLVRYELIIRSNESLIDLKAPIHKEINGLRGYKFTQFEIDYLRSHAPYLDDNFLDYLPEFEFKPQQQVRLDNSYSQKNLRISISGLWHETILYETMIMSIVSEVRNHIRWFDIPYHQPIDVLEAKIRGLRDSLAQRNITNFKFSEMGTRRRFNANLQRSIIDYLATNASDLMLGTSNYHFAKEFNLTPIGTVAHEWFMAHQQLTQPANSQKVALDKWLEAFDGQLGIALTDTIGIDAFLADFSLERANAYQGVRHDSGDPFIWGDKILAHYHSLGIDPKSKLLLFSDGLNFDKALDICEYFADRANISFGIGTFLANDMGDWHGKQGKYQPLSMVIKMVECNGSAVAKISDEPEKAMCEDPAFLTQLKQEFKVTVT